MIFLITIFTVDRDDDRLKESPQEVELNDAGTDKGEEVFYDAPESTELSGIDAVRDGTDQAGSGQPPSLPVSSLVVPSAGGKDS